jgi:hypothetical protein
MITTRITVKPHLKEYLSGKFSAGSDAPVRFGDTLDIYHVVWDVLSPRPVKCPVDRGNLEIVLPYRHEGKRPERYNYISPCSQKTVERAIESMFLAEFHDFMTDARHRLGIPIIDAIYEFKNMYGVDSVSEECLKKNYYRWRRKLYSHQKRGYKKKNSRDLNA